MTRMQGPRSRRLAPAAAEAVLAFLRHRLRAGPALRAPLRAAAWDGHTLTLAFADATRGEVALDLDGAFFSQVPIGGDACAQFEFPFAPSGGEQCLALPRLGRDGAPLAARPLALRFGIAGFGHAREGGSAPLLPLCEAAQRAPFGSDSAAAEVAIVVPVHNAPDLAARCIDAVFAHTRGRARLIVIDDASTDPAVAPLLARWSRFARVTVLRNAANLGFTATANRGIGEAGTADVVLLNADAEVAADWLGGLRRAAYSRADVGTATAVSDNAGAFSVPELEHANALPAGWTFTQSARALRQQAGLAYPELPTGNGFCLYIRRAVIDAVGVLDATAFAQGYGEENDFCQRAAQHGFRHLIAGNVLVRHARSASFGDERRAALGRAGMAVLRERWPGYEAAVAATLFSFERRVLDWRVRRTFAQADAAHAPKPRLLWVGAGAPRWTDAEVLNLRANGARNELVLGDEVIAANTWQADDPEPSYRALWDWLQLYAIERLVVTQRKESAAEILCRLLDIPIAQVDTPFAPTAQEALARAESALCTFAERDR
jgi:GT2 family glycosyltransferase